MGPEVAVVARKQTTEPGADRDSRKDRGVGDAADVSPEAEGPEPATDAQSESSRKRNGGWREIEARRENAALKASLADVWDEDFDLDEEILAELDHTAEFFTTEQPPEDEDFEDDVEIDELFDDDEV
jgi:hypothetical protein